MHRARRDGLRRVTERYCTPRGHLRQAAERGSSACAFRAAHPIETHSAILQAPSFREDEIVQRTMPHRHLGLASKSRRKSYLVRHGVVSFRADAGCHTIESSGGAE
jgi:hypothetical protein